MPVTTCLYCGQPLDGSVEHILLSGLGGKKTSTTICCSTCNNTLGGTIDKLFTERLHIFMNLIDGKTGRKRNTATLTQLQTSGGEKLKLLPGLKPLLSKSTVSESVDDTGHKHIKISAPSENISAILAGKLKQHGVSLDDIQVKKSVSKNQFVSTQFEFAIGRLDDLRAVAKMLLSYLAVLKPDDTRSGSLSEIVELVKNAKDVPDKWLGLDFSTPFPTEQAKGDFVHRMFVFARADEELAFGLLELFGEIRFSCILSDRWQGPTLGKVYLVDPTTVDHSEKNCELPSQITKARLLDREATKQQFCSAINRFVAKAFKKIDDEWIADLADSVLGKHVHRTDLTQEQKISVISHDLAENLARRMYRLDHESNIDINDIIDSDTT